MLEFMSTTHFLSSELRKFHAPYALRPAHSRHRLGLMTLGNVIKQLRKRRGLTQAQLAALIADALDAENYNQSNIPRIENDDYDMPYSLMQAIASVFEITVADLMALTETRPGDPLLGKWLAAYQRLSAKQRAAYLEILPPE